MFKAVFLFIVISVNLFSIRISYATSSILLLGDSLSASYGMKESEGWVSLLNETLSQTNANYKLINASISGETTGGGLSRVSGIIEENEFDYLLLELGGNDGLRGFSPKLIKNNLLQIIEQATNAEIKVILMEIKIPPNYGPRYNKMFADVYQKLSEHDNVTLMPFFIEEVAIQQNLMQADGIHPTKEAQPQLAQIMKKQLDQIMPSK